MLTADTPLGRIFAESAHAAVADELGASPLSPTLEHLITTYVDSSAALLHYLTEQLPEELTTTQAAKELNISRPTLVKKIQEGKIPSHKVGSHTRLKTADVASFLFKRHLKELRKFVRRHVREG